MSRGDSADYDFDLDALHAATTADERRPPLYNPEDYASALKKFCKFTGLQMYLASASNSQDAYNSDSTADSTPNVSAMNRKNLHHGGLKSKGKRSSSEDSHIPQQPEMGLKQFSSTTEMLAKLKADLTMSFSNFTREFISDPSIDGVTLLLDLLKAVQLAQTNITGSLNQLGSRANHVMFKRALADEFECLLCLKICSRADDGAVKLVEHSSGLFTVAVCVMSNFSRSRVLSLQLLTRLCEISASTTNQNQTGLNKSSNSNFSQSGLTGHKQVSDAISMLRLRFGEPVRFKFLVGMLNSYNTFVFQIACLKFLNRFVETSKDAREKIMIQTELEEAGFDLVPMKRFLENQDQNQDDESHASNSMIPPPPETVLRMELERWDRNYIDVNNLVKKLLDAERANRRLREEVSTLKAKRKEDEERDKFNTDTVDRLRECCDKLQGEIDRRTAKMWKSKTSTVEPIKDDSAEDDEDVLLLVPSNNFLLSGSKEDQQKILTSDESETEYEEIGETAAKKNFIKNKPVRNSTTQQQQPVSSNNNNKLINRINVKSSEGENFNGTSKNTLVTILATTNNGENKKNVVQKSKNPSTTTSNNHHTVIISSSGTVSHHHNNNKQKKSSSSADSSEELPILADDSSLGNTNKIKSGKSSSRSSEKSSTASSSSSGKQKVTSKKSENKMKNGASDNKISGVGYSGDSGLSSDTSDKNSNHNDEEEEEEHEDERSFEGENLAKNSEDELNEEIDAMYAERNLLLEEAETLQSERITIDGFKKRFCPSTINGEEGADDIPDEDEVKINAKDKRRLSKDETSNKSSSKLNMDSDDEDEDAIGGHGPEDDESYIVPVSAPRPPARRPRPKSSPPLASPPLAITSAADLAARMEEQKNKMRTSRAFDFEDDEPMRNPSKNPHQPRRSRTTSTSRHKEKDNDEGEAVFESMKSGHLYNGNDTESALSSFGFVRGNPPGPSSKPGGLGPQQIKPSKPGIRRHKSFFNVTNSSSSPMLAEKAAGIAAAKRLLSRTNKDQKRTGIRRAESFQHVRSNNNEFNFYNKKSPVLSRDEIINNFGRIMPNNHEDLSSGSSSWKSQQKQRNSNSVERLGSSSNTSLSNNLTKSSSPAGKKSMDFLKSKLLSRKSSMKQQLRQQQQHEQQQHHHHQQQQQLHQEQLLSFESLRNEWSIRAGSASPPPPHGRQHFFRKDGGDPRSNQKNSYDWRQDTPFWRKQGRWARPAPAKKLEPQIPPQPVMHHIHPLNGSSGSNGNLPGGIIDPHHMHHTGWPHGGSHYPAGGIQLLSRKIGPSYYPSFPVSGITDQARHCTPSPNANQHQPNSAVFLPRPYAKSPFQHKPFGGPPPAPLGNPSGKHIKRNPLTRSNGDIANLDDLADVDPHLLNIEVNHPDETLLSDRLEITELSDEELSPSGGGGGGAIEDGQHLHMRVPTPDYAGQRIVPGGGPRPSGIWRNGFGHHPNQGSSGSSGNILDLASGLY